MFEDRAVESRQQQCVRDLGLLHQPRERVQVLFRTHAREYHGATSA